MIINLVDTVKELLMSYYEANGRKPEAIIYYRDGVAEGQFAQVLRHEYSAIREVNMGQMGMQGLHVGCVGGLIISLWDSRGGARVRLSREGDQAKALRA